jgi:hypothetical protein
VIASGWGKVNPLACVMAVFLWVELCRVVIRNSGVVSREAVLSSVT